MLENWDENVEIWDPWTMGMWPFGTPLTPEFEVWYMMEKLKDEVELTLIGERRRKAGTLLTVTVKVVMMICLIMDTSLVRTGS